MFDAKAHNLDILSVCKMPKCSEHSSLISPDISAFCFNTTVFCIHSMKHFALLCLVNISPYNFLSSLSRGPMSEVNVPIHTTLRLPWQPQPTPLPPPNPNPAPSIGCRPCPIISTPSMIQYRPLVNPYATTHLPQIPPPIPGTLSPNVPPLIPSTPSSDHPLSVALSLADAAVSTMTLKCHLK